MKKKVISVLLATCMIVLSACSNTDVNSETGNTMQQETESSSEAVVESQTQQEPEVDYADGISVEVGEDGIRRVVADVSKVTFNRANGGIILTESETGYGAINYNGEQIVPNQYESIIDYMPDEKGNFMLGNGANVDVFDREGDVVLSIKKVKDAKISSGYVSYIAEDPETYEETANIYNIETGELHSYCTSPLMGGWLKETTDVVDGKCYFSFLESLEGPAMLVATIDGVFETYGNANYYWMHNVPYEGWAFGIWMPAEEYYFLGNEDMTEFVSMGYAFGEQVAKFPVNGDMYYNKGTLVTLVKGDYEPLSPGSSESTWVEKYYLCDFAEHEKEESDLLYDFYEDEINIDALEFSEYVIAEYDYIRMNKAGIFYVEDGDKNFFMKEDGTIIEDSYVDHAAFYGDYTAVVDTDGLAYLMDAQLNVISNGYPAESVGSFGMEVGYVNENSQTIFIVE